MGELNISGIEIFKVSENKQLKAFVTIKLGGCFAIRDIKLIYGTKGYFVAMPSKQMKDGKYVDIAYPVNAGVRSTLERLIIDEYKKAINADNEDIGVEPVILRAMT